MVIATAQLILDLSRTYLLTNLYIMSHVMGSSPRPCDRQSSQVPTTHQAICVQLASYSEFQQSQIKLQRTILTAPAGIIFAARSRTTMSSGENPFLSRAAAALSPPIDPPTIMAFMGRSSNFSLRFLNLEVFVALVAFVMQGCSSVASTLDSIFCTSHCNWSVDVK
jgi:hypothetical protein